MAQPLETDTVPTLASLRRRGNRRAVPEQPNLFSDLFTSEPILATVEKASANKVSLELAAVPNSPSEPVPLPPIREVTMNVATERVVEEAIEVVVTAPATQATTSFDETEAEIEAEAPSVGSGQSPQTWSVSGLVRHVRGLVERGYGQVTVEGEISNWRPAASGHCYFTLKDAGAQLSAVMFRRQAVLVRFRPADGDAVRLHGQLSIYESRGQMQLIVEWMEQVGLGALLAAVQRLKERLRREGLFDRKRPLPPFPRCIGVVTSLQGAALRDIVKVCRRRHAAVQMLIYPAAVQGPNCPAEIAAGLRWFNAHPDRAEVVLVARGGGSWEDLHGFDDERVARAIAGSVLPVITGIGHATDSTVADAAADLCAPTPSAAAEILTAAQHRVEERVEHLRARLLRAGSFELLRAQGRLSRLSAAKVLDSVQDGLNRHAQRVDELGFRAEAAMRGRLRRREARLRTRTGQLERQNPAVRLAEGRRALEALQLRLARAVQTHADKRGQRVERCAARLGAMSPLRVLERGYALVYGPDGHLVRNSRDVAEGAEIRARLAQGDLRATVLPKG